MGNFILGLDVSTKTIGIALLEDLGDKGKLKFLKHVSPVIKPKSASPMEDLFKKVNLFEVEFLNQYKDMGISNVVIEEPLLRSNNVNTVATLLRFNGMVARSVYEILGIVPDFISSYDSRKYAFPELMQKRTTKKNGDALKPAEIAKANPVLFGGKSFDIDKKMVIWELVSGMEPQIEWFFDKNNKLKAENFDMTDSYCAVRGFMRKQEIWE
jgi:hypothetical protein